LSAAIAKNYGYAEGENNVSTNDENQEVSAETTNRINDWHMHWWLCAVCRDHPVGLCDTGKGLLIDAIGQMHNAKKRAAPTVNSAWRKF
jgi:hypothetical protein